MWLFLTSLLKYIGLQIGSLKCEIQMRTCMLTTEITLCVLGCVLGKCFF